MDFTPYFDSYGEPLTLAFGALLIGLVFGIAAQRSRFCLRSAVIDLTGTGEGGTRWHRLVFWLGAFGMAIAATQAAIYFGYFEADRVRQLTGARSLSGVLIGGLAFGAGMVLTRGCVSRLTVLSANGNLRAVCTLLVFGVVAWATFDGPLSGLRQSVLGLWTLEPFVNLNLRSEAGLGPLGGAAVGFGLALAALVAGALLRLPLSSILWAPALGATIAAGWWFTWTMSGQVFEPIAVESVSFTRPAIDFIGLASNGFPVRLLGFGTGLVCGVVIGSFAAALIARELKLEWFASIQSAGTYAIGAALMGFGGVLAGGCSVGAGVAGVSVFALASLVALGSMIAGAAATDLALARVRGKGLHRVAAMPAE